MEQIIEDKTVFHRIGIYCGSLSPTGSIAFEYLAEGAANIIWAVRFHDSDLDKFDNACVVRMRKNLANTIPSAQALKDFEERIAPLFSFNPSLLLPIETCRLSTLTIQALNDKLHTLEDNGTRSEKRRQTYHPPFTEEPHGIIMSNLRNNKGRLIEFKPKWLVQSPTAPRDAQRCRTCALNSMRRQKGVHVGRGDSGFCPFDVLSSHSKILSIALRKLWRDDGTLGLFVKAFQKSVQPALRQLQRIQRQYNQVGLQDFLDPDGKDFSVAMALRDCSVFLVAEENRSTNDVEIRIVKLLDLDLKKNREATFAKWAGIESELIDGGWYTAASADPDISCAMAFQ